MGTISSYTAATAITDDDAFPGNDGSTTKQFAASLFKTYHNTAVLNTQTGTAYTLVLTDAGKIVETNNASANTVTVPPNASVAFPTGTQIDIVQYGAGNTTIVEGSGVSVKTPYSLILATRYARVTLYKRGTDEWVLSGAVV